MLKHRIYIVFSVVLLVICVGVNPKLTSAQTPKPFSLPMALPAGPSTWLLGQPYGNTTGAYNFGQQWYRAGQGLHFGIDFSMPCGTELVAVADGEVAFVDNLGFGAGPHNLLIRHADAGVIVLYGHLLQTPNLFPGQFVQRGQVVALSGDPDVVCDSRPHLHFEVRSLDYYTAYNPVDYIEADWHGLGLIGSFGSSFFQQDLDNPRRWMSLGDQPAVAFGGGQLNGYAATWPLGGGLRPPENPPLARDSSSLAADTTFSQRQFGYTGCCPGVWWHPADPLRLYVVDGSPGQRANVIEWLVETGPSVIVNQAPPLLLSPDGTHQVFLNGDQAVIRRIADGGQWAVSTGGRLPAVSADNSRMMWIVRSDIAVPGEAAPSVAVWVSDINGGSARPLVSQAGGGAVWLDATRLLVTTPLTENRAVTLTVYDTRDDSSFVLGTWEWLRGLSVSPGGKRVMFYLTWHSDTTRNGLYALETQPGALPVKQAWFGGWRWRDADSVYYVPLGEQRLMYHQLLTGAEHQIISTPIRIADGDWSVSADGRRIAYMNADDMTMWLIEEQAASTN